MRIIVMIIYSVPTDTNCTNTIHHPQEYIMILTATDTWSAGNHWTTTELNTGFICASIPVLKAPFTHILRRLDIRSGESYGYGYEYGHSKRKSYGFDKSTTSRHRFSIRHHHTGTAAGGGTADKTHSGSSEEYIIDKDNANGNGWPLADGALRRRRVLA